MEQQEQGVQVDPQKVINSLLRQLSDATLKISVLECLVDQMREASTEAVSELK
jgi:hypothetical protein